MADLDINDHVLMAMKWCLKDHVIFAPNFDDSIKVKVNINLVELKQKNEKLTHHQLR